MNSRECVSPTGPMRGVLGLNGAPQNPTHCEQPRIALTEQVPCHTCVLLCLLHSTKETSGRATFRKGRVFVLPMRRRWLKSSAHMIASMDEIVGVAAEEEGTEAAILVLSDSSKNRIECATTSTSFRDGFRNHSTESPSWLRKTFEASSSSQTYCNSFFIRLPAVLLAGRAINLDSRALDGLLQSVEGEGDATEGTDFGQSRFGHPDLTNVGQSNFGQSIFGSGCVCHGGAPKGGGPKGGPRRVGGAQISRFFFLLPSPFSLFLSLSGYLLVEFWWCLKRWSPNVHVWSSLAVV